ncbi:hypothetical protein ASPVEDRAFT_321879 [Aspergillus versicolor CBS 583.65]|uniref:Histone chaperone domain-containing protein n=1 Tax=Aspergillus versicolor CBS 583.65 TaxID=1036611 RepID=A0A1L9PY74_ASPVE|nr:uncharacterized protein ASPVEDRAFT_321879 [Aspergillus versicolor CBS 583.65]OJJ06386.1 hypothetical protein ASPVEDRAFT_321879 [Aspergillus versicolor CBS 583.65]
MGDNNQATFQGNDPASNAPDAAAYDKGKGKAVDDSMDVSMDEDEESEGSEGEEPVCVRDRLFRVQLADLISLFRWSKVNKTNSSRTRMRRLTMTTIDDDDDDNDNLEPVSADNILSGGRRTRGKTIDYQEAAERINQDEMDEDDDDDEEYEPADKQ